MQTAEAAQGKEGQILDMINNLVAEIPLSVDSITKVTLRKDSAYKDENTGATRLDKYKLDDDPDNMFSEIVMRIDPDKGTSHIAIFNINKSFSLNLGDVKKVYGENYSFSPPNAHQPAGSLSYFVYEMNNCTLRFGYLPPDDMVKRVIITTP